MSKKPTYEELEQRIRELEEDVASGPEKIRVSGIDIEWNTGKGTCKFQDLPAAMMWIGTTLAGLMSGVQAMVGTERFRLALQSQGRRSVEDDWRIISRFSVFEEGFNAIANIAAVAGWGDWRLVSLNNENKECRFQVKDSWEGLYQKSLGVCWGSGMLAGKMAGYCSKLFNTSCWADQTAFLAKGDKYDEFVVRPSERLMEKEIENLLVADEATRADMAVALERLKREISVRHRTEEALRESEERYKSLFKNNHSVMLLVDPENADIVDANSAAISFYGWSLKELKNKKITDINTLPKDQVFQEMARARAEKRRNFFFRHQLANGEILDVEVYSGPIIVHGKSLLYSIVHDVTSRKRAETALRESELKFRSLFDLSPQAVALTAMETGELIDVNKKFCELTKYTKQELLGKTTTETGFYSRKDRSKFIDEFQMSGAVHGLEMDFKAKDGSILNAIMFANAIRIGGETFILTIFHDVTGQKQLETQLRQSHRMEAIGTLAGGIAHDFNNLLMGIQGRTSLMMVDTDSTDSHYKHLKGIEEYVNSASNLTNQLLAFARGGKYEVKPTDLNDLIYKSAEMFGRTKKEIAVYTKYQKGLWPVQADQSQIEQVMLNLYVNAWQSMPGGGELYLETENVVLDIEQVKPWNLEPGRYVKVSITDTGVGMDKATQDRIFDPFFTTREMGRGTGLGLASTYGIINNHDGFINVYSEKGKGATFNIYLPASKKAVVKEEKSVKEILKGYEMILLVDDEDMIIEVGKDLLKKIGYNVLVAKGGKSAVALYEANKDEIDMVILDMIMPGMGGGETFDRLREINPDVKVLLSSGYSIDGQAAEIMQRGCSGFIQKPFSIKDLSQKIREILDKN